MKYFGVAECTIVLVPESIVHLASQRYQRDICHTCVGNRNFHQRAKALRLDNRSEVSLRVSGICAIAMKRKSNILRACIDRNEQ